MWICVVLLRMVLMLVMYSRDLLETIVMPLLSICKSEIISAGIVAGLLELGVYC